MAEQAAELQRFLDAAELEERVSDLAVAISRDHPDGVTLVAVLKGAAPFVADLARTITVPVRLDTVALAPYDGAAGRTRVVKDLDRPIRGESVVVVSSMVDTGLTADFLLRHLRGGAPAALSLCTLVDKPARRFLPVEVRYRACTAPDAFLIGYGLDFAGRYRNLRDLWLADGALLAADPDRYVAQLYGQPPAPPAVSRG